jgi:GMP synthase (glutamine-hydrolysing)
MISTNKDIVIVIQHSLDVPIGLLGEFFEQEHIQYNIIRIWLGEKLPDPKEECKAIVSLGGVMGAYDIEEFPWLIEEKNWLVENIQLHRPVLGICLGCQLLADALGGKAYLAPKIEVGFVEIVLNDKGKRDPMMSAFHNPVLLCHGDTWDLPPNSELLAESKTYPQAFRHKTAVGVQFHPEATIDQVQKWLPRVKRVCKPERYPTPEGIDDVGIIEKARQLQSDTKKVAFELFKAWVNTWPIN